jgi:uncharacterized protein
MLTAPLWCYTNSMAITYDPAKRSWTLANRGLDFAHAADVFAGPTLHSPDLRADYGEARISTVGFLRGRMVIVVWTPRGGAQHVISMRKCNAKEQRRYRPYFQP